MSKPFILITVVLTSMAWAFFYPNHVEAGRSRDAGADRHALVIGVANYKHWPSVAHALDSAQKVTHRLKVGGYTVTLLQDPSSKQLKKAFDHLVQNVGQVPERSIVVYYCGQAHSQILADGTRIGWIVPADSPLPKQNPQQFSHSAVNTSMIRELSQKIESRYMIMLFDAAFDAEQFHLKKPKISSFNVNKPLPVRQYLVAGSAGDSMPKYGLFSDSLVQGLGGEADIFWDSFVTGTELAVFLSQRLAQATKGALHLQYGKLEDLKSAQGDFFFYQVEAALPGSLVVDSIPKNTRIKILNIQPRFHQGMLLAPGSYRLRVAADGFVTQHKWVDIVEGQETKVNFQLNKTKTQTVNSLGMVFRWIEGGRYHIGSPKGEVGRQPDEQRHWITLDDGFWMQTTEVTVGHFKAFISQTGYVTDAQKNGGCWVNESGGRWLRRSEVQWQTSGPWMQMNGKASDHFPATCVSWNDANAFARWLSDQEGKPYRLPSEQQWEVACRAGTSAPFAFGQCLTSMEANYAEQGESYRKCESMPRLMPPKMLETGGRGDNGWGFSDMHGNAAEWCLDRYAPYERSGGDPGSKDLLRNSERIIRGGHYASSADQCRSAWRSSFSPDAAASVIGFRLMQLPTGP